LKVVVSAVTPAWTTSHPAMMEKAFGVGVAPAVPAMVSEASSAPIIPLINRFISDPTLVLSRRVAMSPMSPSPVL
jgi:hypothetical protein